jgi:hypothetical protein
MSDYKFPTEVIELPSKGKFYPDTSPLASGKIDLKYMTAKEEDILTSTNLIQKNVVLDKLVDSLVVTKGVKADNFLIGDLNAIFVAARVLGYGKDYDVKVACQACNTVNDITVDLTTLTEKPSELNPTPNKTFSVELPLSKKVVEFKLLTRGDEKKMQEEIEAYKKVEKNIQPETTTFFRFIITSVDGSNDKATINNFVNDMLVKDSRFLREEYRKASPNVNFEFGFTCNSCDYENQKVRLTIGPKFFWPDARV